MSRSILAAALILISTAILAEPVVVARDVHPTASGLNNQRTIVRNSGGILYCAYSGWDGSSYQIYIAMSNDDGMSWISDWAQVTFDSLDHVQPSLAIDEEDTLHVVWRGNLDSGSDGDLLYTKNPAFAIETLCVSTGYPGVHCPSLAIGPDDDLHVAWTGCPSSWRVRYMRFDFSAGSWGPVEDVGVRTPSRWPSVEVDNVGTPHIVYRNTFGSPSHYRCSHRMKIGGAWSGFNGEERDTLDEFIVSGSSSLEHSSIYIDPNDNLYATWQWNASFGTNPDTVRFRRFDYSSYGWGDVFAIWGNDSSASHTAYNGDVVVDSAGNIYVFYHDNDSCYVAISYDEGASFVSDSMVSHGNYEARYPTARGSLWPATNRTGQCIDYVYTWNHPDSSVRYLLYDNTCGQKETTFVVAEVVDPPEDIISACSDQSITSYITCPEPCSTHLFSAGTTVEYYDSASGTWRPTTARDSSVWMPYIVPGADWVWGSSIAAGRGYWFRAYLNHDCGEIYRATIKIRCDNKAWIYCNGELVDTTNGYAGTGPWGWRTMFEFDLTEYIHGGVDTFTFLATNVSGWAGLAFDIFVHNPGGCCGEIDPYSLDFAVNGDHFVYGDPELAWDGDSTLVFTPQPPDTFENGDTVYAKLVYASDTCNGELDTSLIDASVFFYIDLAPPTIELISPALGDFTSLPDGFTFAIWDSFSGLDTSTITVDVNGLEFGVGEYGADFSDTVLSFNSSDVGLTWSPGDSVIIIVVAMDSPDLCAPNIDTVRFAWFMRDPEAPVPSIVEPEEWIYSACEPESILIEILDPHGIDETTIELEINGDIYTIDSAAVSWEEPILSYFDADGWPGQDTIDISLNHAEDIFGNDISAPLQWSFIVDYQPPDVDMTEPAVEMTRDIRQDIVFWICDDLSGVDVSNAILTVDGVEYELTDMVWNPDGQCGELRFRPEDVGLMFVNGESVFVSLQIGDSPDRCDPNVEEYNWDFFIEPEVGCEVVPNPFTPNGDDINDRAMFFYPNMFSEPAELVVFDSRNREIWRSEIPAQTDIYDAPGRLWNGRTNAGEPAEQGLYIYILNSGGRVVCNGTILLLR